LADASPTAILHELDARRARAFANRDPELLSAVYASPALLAQDRHQLLARVAVGCRLTGLSTGYRSVKVVSRTADRLEVSVIADTAPAVVQCAGGEARPLSQATSRLRITLTASAAGQYRISSLQPAVG
jgi:hypothetical protein